MFQDLLEESVAEYKVVGASFAYWDGQTIQLAATGKISNATGFPVTTDAMFQVGSITKMVTALVIMQFVDEGLAELDAPLIEYLPDFSTAEPTIAQKVSLRHLLNHSSGLFGDFFTDTGWGDDCLSRLIDRCTLIPFIHSPGENFSYCNIGYNILGRVIEVLSQQTFDNAIRTRVFDPLGLEQTETMPHRLLGRPAAIGHASKTGRVKPVDRAYFGRCTGPAGGTLTMSAADMLKVTQTICNLGASMNGNRIVSEKNLNAMLNLEHNFPTFANAESIEIPNNEVFGWGLGVTHFQWIHSKLFGHDGVTLGQTAFSRFDPHSGVGAVLLCNQEKSPSVMEFAKVMLNASVGQSIEARTPPPPALQSSQKQDLRRYVGDFGSQDGTYRFFIEGSSLSFVYLCGGVETGPPQEVKPVGRDAFALEDPEGNILGTVLFQFKDEEQNASSIFTAARLIPRRQ